MQAITKADQLEVKMFPMPEQCKVFTMWINEIVLLVFFCFRKGRERYQFPF